MRTRVLLLCGLLACAARASAATPADGATLYLQHCLMCHQSGGAGLPGQFPRLAGRVADIAVLPEARAWLVQVLSHGMSGTITVDGEAIVGLMPAFAQIPDADTAALLNHLLGFGKPSGKAPAPFSAEEVQGVRAGPAPSATEVHAARTRLGIPRIAP